jgi:predicted secreted protein
MGANQMAKFIKFLSIIAAVSLYLAACGGNISTDAGKTVVVTPAIKGNSTRISVGDTLEVQIPTIPTAGFEWQVQDLDTKILEEVGIPEYIAGTSPNSAGGRVILKFKAVGIGSTTLNLLYASSSSNAAPSMSSDSFSLVVEVK